VNGQPRKLSQSSSEDRFLWLLKIQGHGNPLNSPEVIILDRYVLKIDKLRSRCSLLLPLSRFPRPQHPETVIDVESSGLNDSTESL
jgi:hypothetical protein